MSLTKINNINYFIFLNIENIKYKVFLKYHGKITYFLYGTHFDVSFHNMNKNYVKLLSIKRMNNTNVYKSYTKINL